MAYRLIEAATRLGAEHLDDPPSRSPRGALAGDVPVRPQSAGSELVDAGWPRPSNVLSNPKQKSGAPRRAGFVSRLGGCGYDHKHTFI
jgi:hypothetical protein